MELLNVCQNDAVTWWQHFPFLVTQCHPCSREGPNVNGVECPERIALVWRALCKYKMLLLHPNPTYYSLHGVEFICAESQHTWQILQKSPCPVAVQSLREAHMAVLSHMPKPHLCSTQGPHLSGWILFPHSSPQTINTVPRTTKIEENDNYQPKTSHAGFFSLTNCMRLLTWPKISNGVKARNEYVLACSAGELGNFEACVGFQMAPTSLPAVWAALAQVGIYSPRSSMLLCPLLQVFTFSISFHTRSLSLLLPSRVSMASAINDCSCGTKIKIISVEFAQK